MGLNIAMQPGNNINFYWNDFSSTASRAFIDLLQDLNFSDVTLVCDDSQQLSAHKVVLSAFSDFFKTILQRNPHQHPLIYLKDSKFDHIQAILRFMYSGQTEIGQYELKQFVQTAEDLKIDGLVQLGSSESKKFSEEVERISSAAKEYEGPKFEKTIEHLKEQDDDTVGEVYINQFYNSKYSKENLIKCDNCNKTFTTRRSMVRHMKHAHDEILDKKRRKQLEGESIFKVLDICKESIYAGEESEYEDNELQLSIANPKFEPLAEDNNVDDVEKGLEHCQDDLSPNVKIIKCDMCDNTFTTKRSMRRHKGYTHDGIRYSCLLCDYTASTRGNLYAHQNIHIK